MTVREAMASDAAALSAIYAPHVTDTAVSFELEVPDEAEFVRRMQRGAAHHPWLVYAQQDEVLGYAYATEFRSRAAYGATQETTVYVAPAAQGVGVGRALMSRLLDDLRAAGTHVAIAGITLPNEASVGLHEHLGFELVGVFHDVGQKFGAWHDVGFWELRLGGAQVRAH